jgi:hypothetical protein
VVYGPGIHAASGLGELAPGLYAQASVAYPDCVGGFTAALAAIAAVVGRELRGSTHHLEAPLASAVQPLLRHPCSGTVAARDPELGSGLLETASRLGLTELVDVGGELLHHPDHPFVLTGVET